MNFNRRRFLGHLTALPVVSNWMDALRVTPRQSRPTRDKEWQAKFFAVEILRLINTAEKWNFNSTGKHVRLPKLPASPGFTELKNHPNGSKRFESIWPYFTADGIDIPGFDVRVETTSDDSKYSAVIWMQGPDYSFAFASDERGLIYQGTPLGTPAAGYVGVNQLLENGKALGASTEEASKKELPWWPKLLASITFFRFIGLAVPQINEGNCECCYEFPCSCNKYTCGCFVDCPSCSPGYSYCCVNCGCSQCYWCRVADCSLLCACMNGCEPQLCFYAENYCLCEN